VGFREPHPGRRTITESDNTWFTLITMNTHPLHFDKVYAAKSEFNGCSPLSIYSGPITFCSCSLSSSWELGLSGYPRGLGSDFGG
jgi:acyl dehydratase